MAMGAAALNDAAAWCLLVLAISLGKQRYQIITCCQSNWVGLVALLLILGLDWERDWDYFQILDRHLQSILFPPFLSCLLFF